VSSEAEYVVETAGLKKTFGSRLAVDGVDLRIPRGSAFGYLGPNGAGKTTLIRMLLGLTKPTAGTIRLLGRPIPQQRGQALARIGAIVEEPKFHPFLTGRENLRIVAAARERESHARIAGVLERVGLAHRADDRVKTYSQGMRQRLGVARGLLADPELLILDEPTNGLDPAGIEEFRGLVRELVDEGRTVVLSSHLLGEVERICDAIAIVDRGRVVVQGPISELTGEADTVVVATSDDGRARELVGGEVVEGALRVSLDGTTAAAINRRLVEAGFDVNRLEPERISLERRFLEITSRLENTA
jgi:ABC-2 type transport system ATP-binding protein